MTIRVTTPISSSTDPSKVYSTLNPPDPDVSPKTYLLPEKTESEVISPGFDIKSETTTIVFSLLIISLLLFCLPFVLITSVTVGWPTSSVTDWLLVLLTGLLGVSALISYRQHGKEKAHESDLAHFDKFMNLADSALGTLYSIEALSFQNHPPEKTLHRWNICAQKLSAASRQIESIKTHDMREKALTELKEFQNLFRSFLSKKPIFFFVHLDKCMPSIIAFSSNLWNVEKDDYVLFLMEQIYGRCLFNDVMVEKFISDFDRIYELGYLPSLEKNDFLEAYEKSKEWLKSNHLFMPKEERENNPVVSPCPSKYAVNTIAEFCTDLPKTTYSKEQLMTFKRGSYRNYHWTNFEALYVQLNEFIRTKRGGVKSKRYPEIEIIWEEKNPLAGVKVTRPASFSVDSLFNISRILYKADKIKKDQPNSED